MRVHLFPSRTQKLSSSAPTILGGRLPGKIGNANTKPHYFGSEVFYYIVRVDCDEGPPVSVCGARQKLRLTMQARFLTTAALAAPSLDPPLAAVGLATNPNTEVKLICNHITWRATLLLRCPVLSLPLKRLPRSPTAATRSPPSFRHRRQSARSPGKIGNANTNLTTSVVRFFLCLLSVTRLKNTLALCLLCGYDKATKEIPRRTCYVVRRRHSRRYCCITADA